MQIRVLPDEVINKISAGEVVERPASVVRELVDNSFDAGATDITVLLEDGGQRLISVSDDGCGMERDDALLSLERHATSKLKDVKDLWSIATLGFRGEALPSIAAVSKMTLRSKTKNGEAATEISIEGGKISGVRAVPGGQGTTIEVRQIFFNTPARRKFLKSPRSEELKIKAWLTHASIARPGVRMRLLSDNREILNIPRHDSVMTRAASIFRGTTIPFSRTTNGIEVSGIVGHPSLAQMDTSAFVILVNGRLVSDRLLLRAAKEGFDSTLKDREFPLGFIALEVAPSDVDVNVHPQKSEVRFRHSQAVFEAVRAAVSGGVKEFCFPVRSIAPAAPAYASSNAAPDYQPQAFQFSSVDREQQQPGLSRPFRLVESAPSIAAASGEFRFSDLRYIGQLMECYLLSEYRGKFCVVDMHAAHERYNFNLIRNGFRSRSASSQQLLVPYSVELSEQGLERCMRCSDIFSEFGFEWENFGPTTLVVRAIPSYFKDAKLAELVKETAALTEEMDAQASFTEYIDKIAARLACHASIRSGKAMEKEEVYALFTALDSTEFNAACPHGRPVVVLFDQSEVEEWFGRDR